MNKTVIAAICVLLAACSEDSSRKAESTPSPSHSSQPSQTLEQKAENEWVKVEEKDEMRGVSFTQFAKYSENEANLEFPSKKGKALIILTKRSDLPSIQVQISLTGQVQCRGEGLKGCLIPVKFENESIEYFKAEVMDENYDSLVISDDESGLFVSKLKSSSTVIAEINFYKNPTTQFKFNTSGLSM